MDYPALRSSLDPRLQYLPSEELEELVFLQLGAPPEDVEDFLGGLQDFGRSAGGIFQRALPGVVQGASTGAAFGPWGALIGALGGGVASALSPAPGPQAAGAPPPRPPPAPAPAPAAAAPAPAAPPAAPAAPPPLAASSLVGLLGRPEVIQALGALALGGSGRNSVQVGGTPVPVGAIANLLSVLGSQAAAAAPTAPAASENAEEIPAYLRRADGSLRVGDPLSSQDRAEALLEVFRAAPAPVYREEVEEYEAYEEGESLYESVLENG